MLKNSFVRAVVLIAAALVLAVVSNGFASRTRRVALPGYYPNALKVPPKPAEVAEPAPELAPANTSAAPIAETSTIVPIATDTIATDTTATATTSPATTTTSAPAPATTTTAGTTSAASPSPSPTPTPAANPLARFQPHPSQAYVEISGADAALLHANGVLFLDARRTAVYEAGHIAGARTFSVWESDIDDKVNALFGERSDPRDQDKPIVIYCSGGACEDSHMLSQKLWGIQFNNIYVYKDGFPDWEGRGGAIRKGAQP
jgi:rhodanese-related sulfurtransferase